MKLTSKQENMVNTFLRDVGAQMERYLGADERARRLSGMQQHVREELGKAPGPLIEDADVQNALRSAGKMFIPKMEDSGNRKKYNPQFRLMLTPDDMRWLGVCGGIAARFGLESWMVRAVFFLFALPLAPLMLIAYFGLYCWMYLQSDGDRLSNINYILPPWRAAYTIVIVNVMYYAAEYIREFIFFAHKEYLKRDLPPLGDWDWIAIWNGSCASWVLWYGVPLALLSGLPMRGGWSETLKRIPWAFMALYFIAISFGIASILVGITLDFVDEFTGDPSFIFNIFEGGL